MVWQVGSQIKQAEPHLSLFIVEDCNVEIQINMDSGPLF